MLYFLHWTVIIRRPRLIWTTPCEVHRRILGSQTYFPCVHCYLLCNLKFSALPKTIFTAFSISATMILIVGAGIAGVTLARSLESKDIPFRLFDQQTEYKSQGFGLTLREDTTAKLLPLLGLEEQDFRTRVAVDRKQGLSNSFLANTVTGERFGAGAFKAGYATKDFRTNRGRLRGTIMASVKVEYGHKLKSFSSTTSGVKVVFENGVKVQGDVLVAADGVHSLIRETLLPHCVPQDWDGVMINGSCRFSLPEWDAKIKPAIGDSTVYPGFGENMVLACTIYDASWDPVSGYVDVSWGYSRRRRGDDDPLFVSFTDRSFDKSRAPEAFWEEVETLPNGLVQPFKTIFDELGVRRDRTIHHQLVSLLIPKKDLLAKLKEEKVVFIGDAVHNWSNHAGTAGNAAIQDALALGKVLAEQKGLEEYYDERYPGWLKSFERNGADFQVMHRPMREWRELLDRQRTEAVKSAERL
ncbi:FAD/NAD(P)-binding domain-containing protein [Bimuria novae-zelandiae CBS 107.79]|uniref:FAD/NAD(P)-binding domain-containing protein n=1 Tax=Bimuria novae-zelandiae CBS 107.79 TaxID=1447943 RepID=A0A6A5VS58_9PLEO|nr:FAD/NAD(P)-binding domain-containing protein [Bimuria novae-zelandiae CBS 107.79]